MKRVYLIIAIATLLLYLGIINTISKTKIIYEKVPIITKGTNTPLSIKKVKELYINKDIIGYLSIEGTSIHTFFTQSSDNLFYLNHDLYKKQSIFGNVFMDFRNTVHDKQINLYGHNGNHPKAPFFELMAYKESDFYKEHSKITITLPNEVKLYQIFSVVITDKEEHMMLEGETDTWKKHINFLTKNTLYKTNIVPTLEDSILILQTCTYEKANTYLLICAKKIKGEI